MTKKASWWRGKRGEWYVVIQAALLALLVLGPRTLEGVPSWPLVSGRVTYYLVAGIMMAAGLALAGAGAISLGRNLTPLPHPKDHAQLVERGPYKLVRHPIYSGIIVWAYSWSVFAQSWLTLGYATLLFLFFDLKARREELWLMKMFPGYQQYRKRVRRLIPFLY